MIKELFDRYRNTPSDISGHLQYMHDLCVELGATSVVELGVRTGVSTAAFLTAMEHNGGTVWSADIDAPRVDPEIANHPCWQFVWGDDLELIDLAPEADIVFIDTSHAYQQTLDELDAYSPKARQVILLHDTQLEQPEGLIKQPPVPVRKACLEWLDRNPGWNWEEVEHCYGLGVMRRMT
jgi:cephalosporin hydroxylase